MSFIYGDPSYNTSDKINKIAIESTVKFIEKEITNAYNNCLLKEEKYQQTYIIIASKK